VNCKAISAIVLAAGESSRLGTPKQLVPWQGTTLLEYTLQQIRTAGLDEMVLVLGAFAEPIQRTINKDQLRIVTNDLWPSGKASSIQAGLNAVSKEQQAVIIFLCDQPYLTAELIERLVEEAASHEQAHIVAPRIAEQICNPVFFRSTTFKAFTHLQGEEGGKQLFSQFSMHTFPWGDERIAWDVDTVQDLQKLS
jgi:molybdenum cofactor cytidylyltransferase